MIDQKGDLEKALLEKGQTFVGVDEVGRGCLAGPVVTGALILDFQKLFRLSPKERDLIRDSKKLSGRQRATILPLIKEIAVDYRLDYGAVSEIEELGIVGATFLSMKRALGGLKSPFDLVLLDGNQPIPDYPGAQRTIVKGDASCFSIAAASILAKQERDAYMVEMGRTYPDYGFENHVGYGTKKHLDSLQAVGACRLHRKNFAPVQKSLTPQG